MEARRSPVLSKHVVLRWDLDKTYLATDTESLRGLLRIPFERARHKVALPGVAALVKALRRSSAARGATSSVCFVTASPPQIGRAIREKLAMDGIEFDEIRFKNQIQHLLWGQFDTLREHVGYKLSELLQSARSGVRDGEELLFGDDFESDPLIYSLYADLVAGRLDWMTLEPLLAQAGVTESGYLSSIREALGRGGPRRRVRAIFILRARPRDADDFALLGPRVFWFDSYLECALVLHALGDLQPRGVLDVARECGLDADAVAEAFEAVCSRWPRLRREHLTAARRVLVASGLMREVEAGSLWRRAWTRWRLRRGDAPLASPNEEAPMPDYGSLVPRWAHKARREAMADETA